MNAKNDSPKKRCKTGHEITRYAIFTEKNVKRKKYCVKMLTKMKKI